MVSDVEVNVKKFIECQVYHSEVVYSNKPISSDGLDIMLASFYCYSGGWTQQMRSSVVGEKLQEVDRSFTHCKVDEEQLL